MRRSFKTVDELIRERFTTEYIDDDTEYYVRYTGWLYGGDYRAMVRNGIFYSYWKQQAILLRDNTVLIDCDTYSPTTATDTSKVRWNFPESYIYVSFRILEDYIYHIETAKDFLQLADYKDSTNYVLHVRENGKVVKTIIGFTEPNTPKRLQNKIFYMAQLNGRFDKLEDALEQFIPEKIKDKEYKRHGEWYFIKVSKFFQKRINEYIKKHPESVYKRKKGYRYYYINDEYLKAGRKLGSPYGNHLPYEIVLYKDDTGIEGYFARKSVIHAEGEHKMIDLGKEWHCAIRSPIEAVQCEIGMSRGFRGYD